MSSHGSPSSGHGSGHAHFVPPTWIYIAVWVSLLVLTVITVAVAGIDLGELNTPVAMLVATIKASLVVMFFMGLKWDEGTNKVAFLVGLATMGLFFVLTLADIKTRDWVDPLEGNRVIEMEQRREADEMVLKAQREAADAAAKQPAAPGK
jgi:cytochrome c oxidase subunit 4